MIKLSIILFREFLEISLIINLIVASTRIIEGSKIYISIGLFVGAAISLIFAYFINHISTSFNSVGEELFHAIILLLTSFAILWTLIWIRIKQKTITNQASDIVNKVLHPTYQKIMISFIVASSVLREFIEIVLLSYGIIFSANIQTHQYILSLLIGGVGGLAFGLLLYKTLEAITKKYLFKIFTILLLLISSSMSSEAARILNSSGIVLWLSEPIWDISHIISNTSFISMSLKLFSIGYSSSPSIMEVIFYFVPIIIFLIFSKKFKK